PHLRIITTSTPSDFAAAFLGSEFYSSVVHNLPSCPEVFLSSLNSTSAWIMDFVAPLRSRRTGNDMDVMGVAFRRELFLVTQQVYPELQDKEKLSHTKIQQKLLRKLGDDAFPFFEMRHINYNLPCSVKCAVEFEVKTTFEFLMSEKPLHVKLSLPKEMFYHGKLVRASVEITNSSSRNSKDISTDSVPSGSSLKKEYTLHPLLAHNREWRGLALDRQLKHEDTNLASSSMSETAHRKHTHTLFACACYPVCQITSGVLHCMSYSEVSLEVPFRPMHPKPEPVTVHPAHSNMETSIFVRNSDVCDLELTA
uniref:Arrestin C-terminal-like domain-containing protein n=1 Tax=Monopterus albus TaxID=43700 RepID=A0A3Q3KER0_MONAL